MMHSRQYAVNCATVVGMDRRDQLTPNQLRTIKARETRNANIERRRVERLVSELVKLGWACTPPDVTPGNTGQ